LAALLLFSKYQNPGALFPRVGLCIFYIILAILAHCCYDCCGFAVALLVLFLNLFP
jgi:hypothetical protein